MLKLLELTEREFATGIAPDSNTQNKGLWRKAAGITVVGDAYSESETVGPLQAGAAPTDISASVIADAPFAWVTDVVTAISEYMYIWGNAGNLYSLSLSGDNTPTNVSSGATVSSPANGLLVMQAAGGTKYVLYFQEGQIGRWDPSAAWSTRTNNWKTGLQSTPWHPTHKFQDRGYYGNGHYVGFVYDDGATNLDTDKTALDFDATERVNCISDDGVYLVVGVTKNLSPDVFTHGATRIVFWDTNQSSWQREWNIPDATVLAIKRTGGGMEALTSRGVFHFSFDQAPTQPFPYFASALSMPQTNPTQFGADVWGGALIYGNPGTVSTIGKILPQLPNAVMTPFTGFNANYEVTMVAANVKTNTVYVGTTQNKLFRVRPGDTPSTGVTAESIFIDLQRYYQVGKIVVHFDRPLASGDNVSIQCQQDGSVSFTTMGSATYAAQGAIRVKELYKSLEARKLKLIVNFVAGAVKIRSIEAWGDPIATPTHTRA